MRTLGYRGAGDGMVHLRDARWAWLGLRRRQWVELEDLSWWPTAWRDAGTGFLAVALESTGHATLVANRIQAMLEKTGQTTTIDMGSGGGGPMATVAAALSAPYTIHLTDLHPNLPALALVSERSNGRVTFSSEPVDATGVTPELRGLRTMVNAFHHLPPDAARAVLQSAVDGGQPITVIEVISREPLQLLGLLFSPLTFAVLFPWVRPFRPLNLLFTYLIPVLPAFVLWDGVVSWLRIYDPEELAALVSSLRGADGWTWEIGSFRLGATPAWGVFLEGLPPR